MAVGGTMLQLSHFCVLHWYLMLYHFWTFDALPCTSLGYKLFVSRSIYFLFFLLCTTLYLKKSLSGFYEHLSCSTHPSNQWCLKDLFGIQIRLSCIQAEFDTQCRIWKHTVKNELTFFPKHVPSTRWNPWSIWMLFNFSGLVFTFIHIS